MTCKNIQSNKSNVYERDLCKLDRENFILYYFSIDWENLWKIDEVNVNSTQLYLENINIMLDTFAPLKKLISTS